MTMPLGASGVCTKGKTLLKTHFATWLAEGFRSAASAGDRQFPCHISIAAYAATESKKRQCACRAGAFYNAV